MTITERTVPVPIDLIQALKTVYPGAADDPDGVIGAIVALAPVLPKVGDVVTAETIAELPRKAAIRDADGDIWFVLDNGKVGFVDCTELVQEAPADLLGYGTATLVSLPRD